jgi:hypothetical protein
MDSAFDSLSFTFLPISLKWPSYEVLPFALSLDWRLTVNNLDLTTGNQPFPTSIFSFIRRLVLTSPPIQQYRSLLIPHQVITPEFKRDSHDPLIPYKGSLTFNILHKFCNVIPPDIFKFKVRIWSQPWDSDQQTQPIPTHCFNQNLWYQSVTYPSTHRLRYVTFKPTLGLISFTDAFLN